MYDYAGEWTDRRWGMLQVVRVRYVVAPSIAARNWGLSPLLDSHGNSVRGLKSARRSSSNFDLHVLVRGGDVRTRVELMMTAGTVLPDESVLLRAD